MFGWIRKHWPWCLALLLQVESLWRFIKWALDWRGRYDALAESYHEIGGGSAMIGYILNPPPWFYPAAFVAGLALIFWNSNRNAQVTTPKQESLIEIIFDPTNPAGDFGHLNLRRMSRVTNYPEYFTNIESM
jgi:hypothetical protein